MRNNSIFISVFLLLSCQSNGGLDVNGKRLISNSNNKKSLHISLNQLQGDWKCVYIKCEIACEECCQDPYREIRISNDSAFVYEYPHQFYNCWKINILKPTSFYDKIDLKNDTLIFSDKDYFVRTKFENKIINVLNKDSINASSLIGEWELQTYIPMGYDGEENYDGTIHFPFNVPKTFSIKINELTNKLINGRWIKINTNGRKKDFYITELNENHIGLRTGSWYKDVFTLDYFRK